MAFLTDVEIMRLWQSATEAHDILTVDEDELVEAAKQAQRVLRKILVEINDRIRHEANEAVRTDTSAAPSDGGAT